MRIPESMLAVWMAMVAVACPTVRGAAAAATSTSEAPWSLASRAEVGRQGVYLADLLASPHDDALAATLRLTNAPTFGKVMALTRAQITQLVQAAAPTLASPTWTGPDRVVICRRSRSLAEEDLRSLLEQAMGDSHTRDGDVFELRITRPWVPVLVPDDPVSVRLLEVPASGLPARGVVRFELLSVDLPLGAWSVPYQARILGEVLVARSQARVGQPVSLVELARERRDLMGLRDPLRQLPGSEDSLEMAEYVPSGAVLSGRSVRARALMHRGKTVDATVQHDGMTITVKAEVMEDGRPGEWVRVRNTRSRKEFRGKVQDENTIVVAL